MHGVWSIKLRSNSQNKNHASQFTENIALSRDVNTKDLLKLFWGLFFS